MAELQRILQAVVRGLRGAAPYAGIAAGAGNRGGQLILIKFLDIGWLDLLEEQT
jgi:hypothetical protein